MAFVRVYPLYYYRSLQSVVSINGCPRSNNMGLLAYPTRGEKGEGK